MYPSLCLIHFSSLVFAEKMKNLQAFVDEANKKVASKKRRKSSPYSGPTHGRIWPWFDL